MGRSTEENSGQGESSSKNFPFTYSIRKLVITAGGKEQDTNTSQLRVDQRSPNEVQHSSQCLQNCF